MACSLSGKRIENSISPTLGERERQALNDHWKGEPSRILQGCRVQSRDSLDVQTQKAKRTAYLPVLGGH